MKQYISESISLNEEDTGLINQKDLLSDSFKESGGTYVIQVKPEFLKHFLRSGECLRISCHAQYNLCCFKIPQLSIKRTRRKRRKRLLDSEMVRFFLWWWWCGATPYHPQTDGTTEQVNQEIEAYLSIYSASHLEEWPQALHTLEFTHNNQHMIKWQKSTFDKVWLDSWNLKTAYHKKMKSKWEGPFLITEVLGPVAITGNVANPQCFPCSTATTIQREWSL